MPPDDMGAHFSKPMPVGTPKDAPSHVLGLGYSVYLIWLELNGSKNFLKAMHSNKGGINWSEPEIPATSESGVDKPFLTHKGEKVYATWTTMDCRFYH